ncbi:MAG: hypothetical protein OEQ49_02220 [Myxococcales bacterium]|nr:hypothetical protein [Myxococcales bacterium]
MTNRSATRSRARIAGAALLLVLTVESSASAQGDTSHYQTLQLGERSRGMAAAFTGFAADGAAIWFNPAGLPLLEAKLLQGSLSLSSLRKATLSNAILSDDPNATPGSCNPDLNSDDPDFSGCQLQDFELNSRPTLPAFAVASFAVGKAKYDKGGKPVQIAISAFQTYNNENGGDIQTMDSFGRTNSVQFAQKDRITYLGAAVGYRAIENFLIGLSLFAAHRELDHLETLAFSIGGEQDPTQGSPCPTSPTIPFCVQNARSSSRNTFFQMSAWSLVFRIGLMQLLGNGRWRLGLMFQPPGIQVGGKSTLRFELNDVDARVDPAPSESIFAEVKRGSNSPIPWELRFGVAYAWTKRVAVAADLQLVGPVGEGSITPGLPQVAGRANTSGALLDTDTKRVFTWNISIGTEIELTKFLFTRFGFLTDRSGAPDAIESETGRIQRSSIDRYGFSFSFGGHKNNKGLSFALSALFGKGDGPALDLRPSTLDDPDTGVFNASEVKERVFIISIGGDVGQAAAVVKDEIKEKKRKEQLEEEARQAAERQAEEEAAEELIDDPEIKEATEKARRERLEAEKAEEELEALKERKKQLENLSIEDQEALQKSTQEGIQTLTP